MTELKWYPKFQLGKVVPGFCRSGLIRDCSRSQVGGSCRYELNGSTNVWIGLQITKLLPETLWCAVLWIRTVVRGSGCIRIQITTQNTHCCFFVRMKLRSHSKPQIRTPKSKTKSQMLLPLRVWSSNHTSDSKSELPNQNPNLILSTPDLILNLAVDQRPKKEWDRDWREAFRIRCLYSPLSQCCSLKMGSKICSEERCWRVLTLWRFIGGFQDVALRSRCRSTTGDEGESAFSWGCNDD